jgi:DNA-binding Lrp family transcriptional regulator
MNVKFPDGRRVDSISVRLWMVVGLVILYGIPSLFLLVLQNKLSEYIISFSTQFSLGMVLAMGSMLLTFFAQAFRLRGLSMGKTYIVNALVSISVVLSIPLTLFAIIFIDPLIFGSDISLDFFLWLLKSIGSVLIFIGIVSMVLSEVRGYILIKVKMDHMITDVMMEIQEIQGVQSVSALFGEYDLIIYYRIRSVGKILKLIVREIAQIPGVESVSTQVVLNEVNKY